MDFDGLIEAQTGLGTAAIIVMNKQSDIIRYYRVVTLIRAVVFTKNEILLTQRPLQGNRVSST